MFKDLINKLTSAAADYQVNTTAFTNAARAVGDYALQASGLVDQTLDNATGYPLPVYNYSVTIGGSTISFSEISGLNIEHEHVIYKHGFSFLGGYNIIRGRVKPLNITMKRGIIRGQGPLHDWITESDFLLFSPIKDLIVDLCDENQVPLVRWKVMNAMPVKLDAPTFTANSNEIAIESLEVVAYDIEIEYM